MGAGRAAGAAPDREAAQAERRALKAALRLRAFVVLTALAAISAPAAAQKDVSLETLARAMEGRLGIYAFNYATGQEIALNADKLFPVGPMSPDVLPDPRPAPPGESRPAGVSPRGLSERLARLHRDCPRDLDHPARRALVTGADRTMMGSALSPTIEVGGIATPPARDPGVAGYASTPGGELVFAVLASNLDSAYTATELFPTVVEACFRRLLPEFGEKPMDPKPAGLVLVSLHERAQDKKLFPDTPDAAVADLRLGAQKLKFNPGDTARLAVLARPAKPARVTVQWWSPAQRPEACETQVLDGARLGDARFDRSVDKLGSWRVRVAMGDVIVLDEQFFVTAK